MCYLVGPVVIFVYLMTVNVPLALISLLLLIITNSKTGKKNKSLKTTKKDNIRHGHGVQSVRKVVEKYNGTVSFTDKGDIFEVSAMLYGIEVKE